MQGKERPLPLSELTAISILDGRNREDVAELAPFVSEFNLIRTRVEVEARYLIALSEIGVVRSLSEDERDTLNSFGLGLTLEDAEEVKRIEGTTRHDVVAMGRVFRAKLQGTSLEDLTKMVHFGLTSEDINNLAYRLILKRATDQILVPALDNLTDELLARAVQPKMSARTHGQKAVPTTLGKEFVVFARRLNREVRKLAKYQLTGKLTGAVGNLNALQFTHSEIDWLEFSENFVRSFDFEPNLITTQINPYEDMIEYFQHYQRINGILLDFNQDVWRYISDDWIVQEVEQGATGSSTMPQKVNPIRFENSEGNLGKANALFEFSVRKLPVSRLQRDLSDSTVIRDMGVSLGYSLLAYKNTLKGLMQVRPNEDKLSQDLNNDWSILAEAAQTLMRELDVDDPYTIMLDLTRGRHIGENEWRELVDGLPISEEHKTALHELTPETYLGLAVEITERAIEEIKSSRNN